MVAWPLSSRINKNPYYVSRKSRLLVFQNPHIDVHDIPSTAYYYESMAYGLVASCPLSISSGSVGVTFEVCFI